MGNVAIWWVDGCDGARRSFSYATVCPRMSKMTLIIIIAAASAAKSRDGINVEYFFVR